MTEHSKKRTSALVLGNGAIAGGIVLAIATGEVLTGGILTLIGVVLVAAYSYYQDKTGNELVLPEGIDEELLEDIAEKSADELDDVVEEYKNRN